MAYTNIDDPSAYFQVKVYTGTNANQSITNDGNSDLQPDWIFASYRTLPPYTNHRAIIDSSRGRAKILESDTNAAEATTTNAAYDLVSFDTDGFTVGPVNSTSSLNASGISNVAWQWKANGGTTASNTDGNVTSTVQANQDAGFSIIQYTGTGSTSSTIGHGLGVTPDIIIFKRRNGTNNWDFQYKGELRLTLNLTDAQATNVLCTFTSTTTDLGSVATAEKNANGGTYVAYAFAEKQGYSKFGKYVGNGSTDGAFVYTGFKPAWVMVKQSNTARSWQIFDNKRDGYNKDYMPRLQADNDSAEAANTGASMDFVSNGFKLRTDQTGANQSGGTYIFMAFAENPFTTSIGIPTTAR